MPGAIFATSSLFGKQSQAAIDGLLLPAGVRLVRHHGPGPLSEEELLALARGYEAVICYLSTDRFTARVIAGLPGLKLIARHGLGYDCIDVEAAARCGVLVTTTRAGAGEERAVSDLAMALVLALARDVVRLCARTRAGGWERPLGRDLYGGTLGIVGLGRIGKETALKARAFGLRVVAADPVEDPGFARAAEITYLSLDELLAVADFVVLHCPLTPATRGLIGRRELALMKPTAYLINVARGAVVDEEALYRALKAGRPAGAGLDVYSEEPPRDSPLLTLDNVIALPHIAAYTGATVRAMDLVAVQACLDVLAGKRPANLVCGASGDGGGPSRPR